MSSDKSGGYMLCHTSEAASFYNSDGAKLAFFPLLQYEMDKKFHAVH